MFAFTAAPAHALTPPIKHVWVVVLENQSYATTFAPNSQAPFLAKTLPANGALLTQYYGTAHESLGNYIALLGGQGPNPETQSDCQFYTDVQPGTVGPDGQALGLGCVYPSSVKTLADQLQAKGLVWKGYMQDMGNDPAREAAACAHPALNSMDGTQKATATDSYATRHNPFMYFHSIIDSPLCTQRVVPLTALPHDLASAADTPAFSFITPNLCEDGHDAPCADGRPGGLISADAFLQTWIPRITGSPAFADGGLVIVTFDEAENDDASSCCGEGPGLGSPLPGIFGTGGGRIGAVMLSPYIKPGTVSQVPYNHYALLRSLSALFSVPPVGLAAASGLNVLGDDVFTQPGGPPAGAAASSGVR
jgi:phosphatidylinositol-3-phosphatase